MLKPDVAPYAHTVHYEDGTSHTYVQAPWTDTPQRTTPIVSVLPHTATYKGGFPNTNGVEIIICANRPAAVACRYNMPLC